MESIIKDMLEEERNRNLEMLRIFQAEIAELPRGSLVVQSINGHDYCYLKYREGDRIVSKYAGKATDCREKLEKAIARRRQLEQSLRRINYELKLIQKAVGT